MPFVPHEVGFIISVPVFLASAVAVVFLGVQLAKYGDALATLTGWGRLFVGSILVALATSLPELSHNFTAVRIDEPELALGDVLGSNIVNILILAVVALLFGGRRFLRQVAPEQGYLIVLAAIMTGLAVILAAWHSPGPRAPHRGQSMANWLLLHFPAGGLCHRYAHCLPASCGLAGRG